MLGRKIKIRNFRKSALFGCLNKSINRRRSKNLKKNYKNLFFFSKLRLDNLSRYKRFFSFIFFSSRKRNRKVFRLISFETLFYTFIKYYKSFLRVEIYSFFFNLAYLKHKEYGSFFFNYFLNKLLSRFILFKRIFFSKYMVYFILRYFLVFLLNCIELFSFKDEFYNWNWRDRNFLKIVRNKKKNLIYFCLLEIQVIRLLKIKKLVILFLLFYLEDRN